MASSEREHLVETPDKLGLSSSDLQAVDKKVTVSTADPDGHSLSEAAAQVQETARIGKDAVAGVSKAEGEEEAAVSKAALIVAKAQAEAQQPKATESNALQAAAQVEQVAAQASQETRPAAEAEPAAAAAAMEGSLVQGGEDAVGVEAERHGDKVNSVCCCAKEESAPHTDYLGKFPRARNSPRCTTAGHLAGKRLKIHLFSPVSAMLCPEGPVLHSSSNHMLHPPRAIPSTVVSPLRSATIHEKSRAPLMYMHNDGNSFVNIVNIDECLSRYHETETKWRRNDGVCRNGGIE